MWNGLGAPLLGLRDIRGLDAIGLWPTLLSLLVALAFLAVLIVGVAVWRGAFQGLSPGPGWRARARGELARLEGRPPDVDARAWLSQYSTLLRRVAIARCGRIHCAGLSGRAWLEWLSACDPRGEDWRAFANLLLAVPYAGHPVSLAEADRVALLRALRGWIDYRGNVECGDPYVQVF